MKYVTMELGGKSPCIILPDAELENAVDGAMMANFFSTGQVCTNGTRVFVPKSMLQAFEKRLVEKMEHVRLGDLMDPNTNFGPLVSKVHFDKVVKYMTKFERSRTHPYAIITPSTPLAELETFLADNLFALGKFLSPPPPLSPA